MTLNEVAVVFVHGIGTQKKGSTLSAWGEPLTAALDRRVGADDVYVEQANLTLGDTSDVTLIVPAHEDPDGKLWAATRIYLTEARWADAFLVQSASTVLGWGLSFALRALLRIGAHLGRLAYASLTGQAVVWWNMWSAGLRRPRPRAALDAALFIVYAAGLILAAPIVAVAVLIALPAILAIITLAFIAALVIFAGTKVPVFSRYLRPIATGLVASVGDASVWTSQPLAAAAMRTVVVKAISRAQDRKPDGLRRKVVVVAHSQGAAITVDALFGGGPDLDTPIEGISHSNATDERPDLLVTVGGAATLLRNVRTARKKNGVDWNPIAQWQESTNTRWINVWALWDPVSSGPMGLGEKGSDHRRFAACQASGIALTRQYGDYAFGEARRRSPNRHPGLDYASKSLSKKSRSEPGPEEWPVYNTSLMLTDHTTYTLNSVQVIEPLCTEILRTAAGERSDSVPETSLALRRVERHIAGVRRLAMVRLLAVLTLVVLLPFTLRVPGFGYLQTTADTKIRAISEDNEPAQLFVAVWDWLAHWLSGLTLGIAAVVVIYTVVGYIALVSPFKAMVRMADERNVAPDWRRRWKDWPARLCTVYMLLLAAAITGGLHFSEEYSAVLAALVTRFDLPMPWIWAAISFALLIMVLQPQWGTRLYRTAAIGHGSGSPATESVPSNASASTPVGAPN